MAPEGVRSSNLFGVPIDQKAYFYSTSPAQPGVTERVTAPVVLAERGRARRRGIAAAWAVQVMERVGRPNRTGQTRSKNSQVTAAPASARDGLLRYALAVRCSGRESGLSVAQSGYAPEANPALASEPIASRPLRIFTRTVPRLCS